MLSVKEKMLLEHRVIKLEDGRYGYVFSFKKDQRNRNVIYCHICLTSFCCLSFLKHNRGKKHTNNEEKIQLQSNFSKIIG